MKLPQRRSVRLQEFDYRQAGAYFVTICTKVKRCIFGKVNNAEMKLSAFGRIVEEEWLRTVELRDNLVMDCYVVMPNHFHTIVFIVEPETGVARYAPTAKSQPDSGAARCAPTSSDEFRVGSHSLGAIVRAFKSAVTRRCNFMKKRPGVPIWQRGYYEHVIRNEVDLRACREYVLNNPLKWQLDKYHSMN